MAPVYTDDPRNRRNRRNHDRDNAHPDDPNRCADCGHNHDECVCGDDDDDHDDHDHDDDHHDHDHDDLGCEVCGNMYNCGYCTCEAKCEECLGHVLPYAHCENCPSEMCNWCRSHEGASRITDELKLLVRGTDPDNQRGVPLDLIEEHLGEIPFETIIPLYSAIRENRVADIFHVWDILAVHFKLDSRNFRCGARGENGESCVGCLWSLLKNRFDGGKLGRNYDTFGWHDDDPFTSDELFRRIITAELPNAIGIMFSEDHIGDGLYSCMHHEQEAYNAVINSLNEEEKDDITWVEVMWCVDGKLNH